LSGEKLHACGSDRSLFPFEKGSDPKCRSVTLVATLLGPTAPDTAVIQECAKPAVEDDHCLWFGDNPRQGLAVVSRGRTSFAR
jgi:hypothetical protein